MRRKKGPRCEGGSSFPLTSSLFSGTAGLTAWQSDSLTVWLSDSLTVWQSDSLSVWQYDCLTTWQPDILTVGQSDSLMVWELGSLGLSDSLRVWRSGDWEAWELVHLAGQTIWLPDSLTVWQSDSLTVWERWNFPIWLRWQNIRNFMTRGAPGKIHKHQAWQNKLYHFKTQENLSKVYWNQNALRIRGYLKHYKFVRSSHWTALDFVDLLCK